MQKYMRTVEKIIYGFAGTVAASCLALVTFLVIDSISYHKYERKVNKLDAKKDSLFNETMNAFDEAGIMRDISDSLYWEADMAEKQENYAKMFFFYGKHKTYVELSRSFREKAERINEERLAIISERDSIHESYKSPLSKLLSLFSKKTENKRN